MRSPGQCHVRERHASVVWKTNEALCVPHHPANDSTGPVNQKRLFEIEIGIVSTGIRPISIISTKSRKSSVEFLSKDDESRRHRNGIKQFILFDAILVVNAIFMQILCDWIWIRRSICWHRTHLIVVWRQLLQQLSDSVLVASTVGIRDFLFGNLREIQLHLKSSEKLRRWTRVGRQEDGFQGGFPRIPYN